MKNAFLLATLAATALVTTAADWPQWRGADRTDISKESGLLKSWPEGGPKLAWINKDVGLGYSGYAIANGKLFTMGLRGENELLIAVDVKTGKELWATPVGPIYKNGWGDGPRSSPTVDGDLVFALAGNGQLLAAKAADGKEVWKATLRDFGGKTPGWGYCESVLVDEGKVICTPGGSQGTLLALDKATGKRSGRPPTGPMARITRPPSSSRTTARGNTSSSPRRTSQGSRLKPARCCGNPSGPAKPPSSPRPSSRTATFTSPRAMGSAASW